MARASPDGEKLPRPRRPRRKFYAEYAGGTTNRAYILPRVINSAVNTLGGVLSCHGLRYSRRTNSRPCSPSATHERLVAPGTEPSCYSWRGVGCAYPKPWPSLPSGLLMTPWPTGRSVGCYGYPPRSASVASGLTPSLWRPMPRPPSMRGPLPGSPQAYGEARGSAPYRPGAVVDGMGRRTSSRGALSIRGTSMTSW